MDIDPCLQPEMLQGLHQKMDRETIYVVGKVWMKTSKSGGLSSSSFIFPVNMAIVLEVPIFWGRQYSSQLLPQPPPSSPAFSTGRRRGQSSAEMGSSLPSGKRLHSYGKSPFLMGKLTINGHVQ